MSRRWVWIFAAPHVPTVYQQALSGAVSFTGAIAKSTAHIQSAALTFSGVTTKLSARSLAGALTFSGNQSKLIGKALTGALTFNGSISRAITRAFTAALTFSGNVSKSIRRTLAGVLTFSGSLTASHVFNLILTAAVSFSGSITKATRKSLSATLTFSGAMRKLISRTLAGVLTLVGAFTAGAGTLYTIMLTAAVSFAGTIGKQTRKGFTASLGPTGSGIGPRIILVGERLAMRIKNMIYTFLD